MMSDTPERKLNLKALTQNPPKSEIIEEDSLKSEINGDIDDIADDSTTPEAMAVKEEKTETIPSTKMSFASIRKPVEIVEEKQESETEETSPETPSHEIKEEKIEEIEIPQLREEDVTEEENNNSQDATIKETNTLIDEEKVSEKIEEENQNSLESKEEENIPAVQTEKVEAEVEAEAKAEPEEVKFSNYESHFKKESTNFLSKFQKFRYAPKTRTGFLLGIIGITVFTIGSLMILVPDKHSPEIYKASIMQILGKSEKEIEEENPITVVTPVIQKEEIIDEIVEEKVEINQQQESKEILRQYLLNKYKK